jgi:hypothetical protein
MARVSVLGHPHMIGRVSEVHTTMTTHACGLAGIMWDAGMKMNRSLVRKAYWYEDDGICIRRVRVTTSVRMLARLQYSETRQKCDVKIRRSRFDTGMNILRKEIRDEVLSLTIT